MSAELALHGTKADLLRCEAAIFKNLKSGLEFWLALAEIYDRELWRVAPEGYSSWTDYLKRRWPSINANFAHRKVKDARARQLLPGAEELSDRAMTVLAAEIEEIQQATLALARQLFGDNPT